MGDRVGAGNELSDAEWAAPRPVVVQVTRWAAGSCDVRCKTTLCSGLHSCLMHAALQARNVTSLDICGV